MKKKVIKEESDNELDDEINEDDNNEDENIEDELSDDLNDEINSQYMTEELLNDKDIDVDYIDDIYNIDHTSKNEYLYGDDRISCNRLTKYEMVRILGERVKQLIMGAKPMIKNYKDLSYEEIAEYELLNNILPFKIKRILPSGKYEIWSLEELSKEHLIHLINY